MNYKCIMTCKEIEINLERTSEASALVDRDFFVSYDPFIIHTARFRYHYRTYRMTLGIIAIILNFLTVNKVIR